jgi:hypothetical protein
MENRMTDLILSQLTDPFRIGLLIALFYTMLRTQAATGTIKPLALGAVFVAVIIPITAHSTLTAPMATVIGAGILANIILLAVILGAWTLYLRSKA